MSTPARCISRRTFAPRRLCIACIAGEECAERRRPFCAPVASRSGPTSRRRGRQDTLLGVGLRVRNPRALSSLSHITPLCFFRANKDAASRLRRSGELVNHPWKAAPKGRPFCPRPFSGTALLPPIPGDLSPDRRAA